MNHHAYVYEGALSLFVPLVAEAKARFGFNQDGHPDVHAQVWEKFGIDESRELVQLASLRFTSGKALFVLGISSITSEAQQALLKLFEEPQEGSIFILLVPQGALLPTLQSRFLEYPQRLAETASKDISAALEFLGSPYAKRSAWVTAFLKEIDEDNAREQVRDFIGVLEAELYAQPTSKDVRDGLQDIAHFRQYLSDRAPSLKMILEHFAATLPTVSTEIKEKVRAPGR